MSIVRFTIPPFAVARSVTHRALACGALVLIAGVASAAGAAGGFELGRVRVSSGAATFTGGLWQLDATIAQADASPPLVGGAYALTAGIRRTHAAREDALFADHFETP
jgi:hypothetical protein